MLTLGRVNYPLFPEKIHLLLETTDFAPGLACAPFARELGLGLSCSSATMYARIHKGLIELGTANLVQSCVCPHGSLPGRKSGQLTLSGESGSDPSEVARRLSSELLVN